MSLVLRPPTTVAVIGAGIAGLTAARHLREGGVEAIVFEARDRVGGRAHTVTDGLEHGQHADLGGELVFDGYHATIGLCAELGVELSERVYQERSEVSPGETSLEAFLDEGRIIVDGVPLEGEGLLSLRQELRATIESQPPLPYEVLDQWSRRARLSPIARAALSGIARFTTQAELDQLDGHFLFGPPLGGWRRVVGGTQRFAEALAQGVEVRCSTPVRSIRQGGGVEIASEEGERWRFDRAVVTAPFPVVTSLGFDPPLPATKLAALNAFQPAVGGKVVAQYAEGDAVRAALTRACVTGGPINSLWVGNPYVTEGPAVVMGFFCGADRTYLESPEDALTMLDELVEAATSGPVTRIGQMTKDWTADPWSLAITTTPGDDLRADLVARAAAPFGRIQFAGDYTDVTFAGIIEGAVRSGQRAADEILRRPARIMLGEIDTRLVRQ